MENIFTTKEQFVAYRTFWKQFHKDKKHKGVPVPQTAYNYSLKELETVGYHMVSPLTAIHHLFHCVIMGKNPDKGFKNMYYWNMEYLLWNIEFSTSTSNNRRQKLFEFYEGSIPEELHDVIIARAKEYLTNSIKEKKA